MHAAHSFYVLSGTTVVTVERAPGTRALILFVVTEEDLPRGRTIGRI